MSFMMLMPNYRMIFVFLIMKNHTAQLEATGRLRYGSVNTQLLHYAFLAFNSAGDICLFTNECIVFF